MKYQTSINVELPRSRLLEILEDPEGWKSWQPGLISYEFLDEDHTIPGAGILLVYDMNGRKMQMRETLVERLVPESMTFIYEAKGVWNQVVNRFTEEDGKTTKWVQENEFRCRGFMALLCALMPGSFKKETRKSLQLFKNYAEGL
jgi:hypothetical protein